MSKRIMAVADGAAMRKMISFTLKGAGYEILEASDGRDALNTLAKGSVDLVITDINLSNMDGLELTRQLRLLPAFARTPILLLTTESDPGKKTQGRTAGATSWIVKPFSQEQLIAVVTKVLRAGP